MPINKKLDIVLINGTKAKLYDVFVGRVSFIEWYSKYKIPNTDPKSVDFYIRKLGQIITIPFEKIGGDPEMIEEKVFWLMCHTNKGWFALQDIWNISEGKK